LRRDVLQDVDLIEVIRHRTMEHQLSVATRRLVSEVVSEVLVDTGNEDVIATLLQNDGAGLSREVMEYLVGESKRIDRYQIPLAQRSDLPSDLAHRMYWWVTAALRKHIVENFSIDAAELDAALDEATEGALESEVAAIEKPDETEALINRLVDLGELTPALASKALLGDTLDGFAQIGMAVEQLAEIARMEREQLAKADRDHIGHPRGILEQRDLAEESAAAQADRLALADRHLHGTGGDEIHAVADLTLVDNELAGHHQARFEQPGNIGNLGGRAIGEKRHLGDQSFRLEPEIEGRLAL
jgi:hypothetical protein